MTFIPVMRKVVMSNYVNKVNRPQVTYVNVALLSCEPNTLVTDWFISFPALMSHVLTFCSNHSKAHSLLKPPAYMCWAKFVHIR